MECQCKGQDITSAVHWIYLVTVTGQNQLRKTKDYLCSLSAISAHLGLPLSIAFLAPS